MRRLLFISLLISAIMSFGQSPQGKLFEFTGTGGAAPPTFGYIEYPARVYHVIDTIQLNDIKLIGNKIYAAGLLNVIAYDTSTYKGVDTIPNLYAHILAAWGNDKMAVISDAKPYFRMYDLQTHALVFGLDSTKVSQIPYDLKVSGNRAYLAMKDSIIVIDLVLQDTIARAFTPHPLAFAGYNQFLIDSGENLFIDVEYVTGAIRFSLMRMNKSTFRVDTMFHEEGHGNFWRPVLAAQNIYLLGFDAHYNIPADTLILSASDWTPLPTGYDPLSGAIFLFHTTGYGISYFSNGTFSDTIPLNGYLAGALFVPDAGTVTSSNTFNADDFGVYPNPSGTSGFWLNVSDEWIGSTLEISDEMGRLVYRSEMRGAVTAVRFNSSPGVYLLRLISEKKTTAVKKLVRF